MKKRLYISALIMVAVGALLQIGAAYILYVVQNMIAGSSVSQAYEKVIEGLSSSNSGMIVYVIVVAPLIGEFIFRYALIGLGKKFMKFQYINLIQAILFAIYHGNIIQGVYAFIIGLIFGWIFENRGGFISSYIVHSVCNMSGLFITPKLPVLNSAIALVIGLGIFAIVLLLIRICPYRAQSADSV